MASCSRGSLPLGALCALLLALPGCWTGRLIEEGRRHERVVTYTQVALEGDELRLDYTAELSNAHEQPLSRSERSAIVTLAALAAEPEHPVEVFPLARVRGSQDVPGVPVALVIGPRRAARVSTGPAQAAAMVVEIDERNGRHAGFRLCPVTDDPCVGHFHSAALYDDSLAWWVYPIVPLTAAVDLVLLPIQVVTLPALLLSD